MPWGLRLPRLFFRKQIIKPTRFETHLFTEMGRRGHLQAGHDMSEYVLRLREKLRGQTDYMDLKDQQFRASVAKMLDPREREVLLELLKGAERYWAPAPPAPAPKGKGRRGR
jgi:hypothetical protein